MGTQKHKHKHKNNRAEQSRAENTETWKTYGEFTDTKTITRAEQNRKLRNLKNHCNSQTKENAETCKTNWNSNLAPKPHMGVRDTSNTELIS
jgi:hypothetical protein